MSRFLIIFILLLSLVIRIAVIPYGTFGDINAYREWSQRLAIGGFEKFYNVPCLYLPGYIYALFVVGKLGLTSDTIFKLPSIITDLVTVYLVYLLVKGFRGRKQALIASFIYGISPSIFANSAMWGQTDSAAMLPTFLSFYFFVRYLIGEKNFARKVSLVLSGLFLGLSFATKPNGIFLLPFLFLVIFFGKKFQLRRAISEVGIFLASAILYFLILFLPFTGTRNYFRFVSTVVIESVDCHTLTSYAAFNFWRLYKDWSPDSGKAWVLTYKQWGRAALIFYLVFLSIVFIKKIRKANDSRKIVLILAETLVLFYLFWFLFTTGVHERHIFPIFSFLAVVAGFKNRYWIFYFILMAVSTINLGYVSRGIVFNQNYLYTPELLILYPLINIAVWVVMMVKFLREK